MWVVSQRGSRSLCQSPPVSLFLFLRTSNPKQASEFPEATSVVIENENHFQHLEYRTEALPMSIIILELKGFGLPLCGLEHLAGVAARGLRDICACEHTRYLFDAGASVQAFDSDFCSVTDDLLLH